MNAELRDKVRLEEGEGVVVGRVLTNTPLYDVLMLKSNVVKFGVPQEEILEVISKNFWGGRPRSTD